MTSPVVELSRTQLTDRLREAEATIVMVRITIARAQADGSDVVAIRALNELLGDTNVDR